MQKHSNPFRRSIDWGDWMIGAVVAVTAVAALLWAVAWASAHDDLSAIFEPARPASPYEDAAAPDRSVSADDRAPVAREGVVAVFACTHGGHTTYSDQPCGDAGELREIDVGAMNVYTPVEVHGGVATDTSARSVSRSGNVAAGSGEATADPGFCASILEEIERIDARMRAGYGSREGERLRAQWRDAKHRYHEAGCTWSTN